MKEYRLICLNTWVGMQFDLLMDFVERKKALTDIFCFQEVTYTPTNRQWVRGGVRANLLQDLRGVLAGFNDYFAYATEGYDLEGKLDYEFGYGQGTFWNQKLSVISKKAQFVHRNNACDVVQHDNWWESPRNVLITDFKLGEGIRVANVHGIWEPGDKSDSPDRVAQAIKLSGVFKDDIKTILVGDFNLGIDNESLKMIEQGRRNLIRETDIKSTRSSFYKYEGRHADYAIVDQGVNIKKFAVLEDEVSDHLPLEIIFEV